jgi:hypothetical protein
MDKVELSLDDKMELLRREYGDGSESNNLLILRDMLECNSECAGDYSNIQWYDRNPYEQLRWMHRNLPAVNYVTDRTVDYIFSNGLTTNNVESDKILNDWLYSFNDAGTINLSVLRSAVKRSMIYGRCGVRILDFESGIIPVYSRNYAPIYDYLGDFTGVKGVTGFLMSYKGENLDEIDLTDVQYKYNKRDIISSNRDGLLLLPPDDFINLRWDPSDPQGKSPLLYDRMRLDLLSSTYQRLNYDLEYDGPGRIILRFAENFGDMHGNETSTKTTLGGTDNTRAKKAYNELEQLARRIKESSSDAVIAVSDIFDKTITHLPRVTNSTEFLDYASTGGEIMCQVFGIPPALLEFGKVSGNVSMEKIIDNAVLNSIIPIRERYSLQISNILSKKLGLPMIEFNKYGLQQYSAANEGRKLIVDIISGLKDQGYDVLADDFIRILQDDVERELRPAEQLGLVAKIHNLFKLGRTK